MSGNYPALVAGSDGRAGHLRLDVETAIRIDLAPIGMITTGTAFLGATSTPPYVSSLAVAPLLVVGRILPPFVFASPGFDLKWTLTGLALEYFRAAAGDALEFQIYRGPRSGHAAAGSTLVSLTSGGGDFATTAAWTSELITSGSLPVVLDFSLYSYTYRYLLTPSTLNTDVRVGISSYGTATVQAVL